MARCDLPEAGAAGASRHHARRQAGRQARGTKLGLARPPGVVQPRASEAGQPTGTVSTGPGRPQFFCLRQASFTLQCWRKWTVPTKGSTRAVE